MKDNLSFYEQSKQNKSVAIVAVPLELGSDERGLADAPAYLFENGLEKVLARVGCDVSEVVHIPRPEEPALSSAGPLKHVQEIVTVAQKSFTVVEKAAKRGDFVLALGGDHSMAFGSIAGAAAAYPSIGVIYIDAHPDCHTHETTITGNVHGMVTSTLTGAGHPPLQVGIRTIPPEHLLYVGLKDFDAPEIEFLRREKTACITMFDITRHGLPPVLAAIDALTKKVDVIWVSMDMDSIDASEAPGVGLAMPGGLTRREVLALAQYIGKSCTVAGLDIVEISPKKDVEKKTARLALELIARFLGGEYSWYQNEYIDAYR